jgi:hypothetical protein
MSGLEVPIPPEPAHDQVIELRLYAVQLQHPNENCVVPVVPPRLSLSVLDFTMAVWRYDPHVKSKWRSDMSFMNDHIWWSWGRIVWVAIARDGRLFLHPKEWYPSIECPKCRRISYNPHDIQQRYCGACHQYHDQLQIVPEPEETT